MTTIPFAIPGDLTTKTGGYIYDARVIDASGGALVPVALPSGFPFPTAAELTETQATLAALPGPALIDGLAYGALSEGIITSLPFAPVALCHHPLGHEPGLERDIAERLIAMERHALALAAHTVVTSETTKRTLVDEFGLVPEAITVAPPGLDRAPPARAKAGPPLILTVASITPRKGHDVLVRALARIEDQDWTCLLAGPDDRNAATADALRAQIAAAEMKHRIHMIGPQSAEELDALYARATIFCLPSRYEGYGMVFAEAMMRGLPVVACDAGAVADLVPCTAGRLVPVDDDAALASAIGDLLRNPVLRTSMAQRGREFALSIPGWDATWRTIRTLMEHAT
ncbi:MAG: glycosyltransferase family 4 protein [Pseudomonadota bacterium]